ncbi:MAG TPA: (d)CMP kinase [Myxococcales bacterium]|jgi:cytidylate kinase
MKRVIVAIDGPAGAGKSSVAKAVAEKLGLALVDTGAIYRCVALAAQRAEIDWSDDEALARLLPWLDIAFKIEGGVNRVSMRGEDVTEAIRTPEISKGASAVSARPVVRAGLLDLQRKLARGAQSGAVLEGRDIGTVVFPEATVKLFVTASDEVRAERRHQELKAKGMEVPLEQVLADQRQRDKDDSTRDVAPLKPAYDAKLLDTSTLPLDQVIDQVVSQVERAMGR